MHIYLRNAPYEKIKTFNFNSVVKEFIDISNKQSKIVMMPKRASFICIVSFYIHVFLCKWREKLGK